MDTATHSRVEQQVARPEFRPDIQGLRAVAVLLVVASHAGIEQLAGGFIGVDVFFVISGFLITGLLINEAELGRGISLLNFYARRARRILPAAALVLLTTLGASMYLLGAVRASEVARDALWTAAFAVNWKFSADGTDYFASGLPPSPLQHYWSLAVEEQFYLVWPALFAGVLAIFLGRARGRRRRRIPTPRSRLGLTSAIAFLAAGSLVYSLVATAASPNAAFFSTGTRAWELAVGALLALVVQQLADVPEEIRTGLSWLGLVAIAAGAVIFSGSTPFPGAVALLPVLGAALVIAGGAGRPRKGAVLALGTAPMRWIGDRSYSLYLWHWPILIIATAYLGRDLTAIETAGLVAAALLATVVTYALIEYPIHKGRLQSTRTTSLALWPASIAFVALVSLVAIDAAKSAPSLIDPTTVFSPVVPSAAPGSAEPPAATGAASTAAPGSVEAAVAEAVATARVSGPIPEVLTPALDQLRADTWEVVAPCAAETNQSTTDICGYGPSDAGRSMVIIGDSHAGMWVQGLKQIAETAGWRFTYFVKGGCSSADIVLVGSGREGRQGGCQDWRTWALGQIADLHPDIAILADRGDKPFVGADGAEIASGTPQHDQAWEAGVSSTITTLRDAGVGRVIVFSETPIMNRDGVTCLGAANANLGDCLTPLAASIQGTAAAGQRAAAAAGGEYMDVNRWLCADNLCPMVVNDIIVYSDGQHVTLTYGAALAETMKVELALT